MRDRDRRYALIFKNFLKNSRRISTLAKFFVTLHETQIKVTYTVHYNVSSIFNQLTNLLNSVSTNRAILNRFETFVRKNSKFWPSQLEIEEFMVLLRWSCVKIFYSVRDSWINCWIFDRKKKRGIRRVAECLDRTTATQPSSLGGLSLEKVNAAERLLRCFELHHAVAPR